MFKVILLNVDELWLKGKNRSYYMSTLAGQIRMVVKKIYPHPFELKNENQRFILSGREGFQEDSLKNLLQILARVPGLFSLQPARVCKAQEESIKECAKEELKEVLKNSSQNFKPTTFCVRSKRSFKQFPLTSMELDARVGEEMGKHFSHLKVKLIHPDIEIQIKIVDSKKVYMTSQKILGVGGLPKGTSGKLITLLSGGFDSPVASYLMSARGCEQRLVFFHAYPFVGDEVKEKMIKLGKILAQYQVGCTLQIIPFGKVQEFMAQKGFESYRTLLFRYGMILTAELLAKEKDYHALCTGDSLAQVSSQTIGNLALLDKSKLSSKPILRPLMGMSKRDIMAWAQKIGTHKISLIPHDDACSLLAPRNPIIHPNEIYWDKVTHQLREKWGLLDQLQTALGQSQEYSIDFRGRLSCLS